MATDQPLQDVVHHDDALRDLRSWAKRQVLRIEALSKQQVLCELRDIMEGYSYSWHCINELLQARFEEGSLEFSLVDGDVLFEWNNLCNEKRAWEKKGRLSINNAEFNMDCLINLKIIPVQAGFGIEGPRLVSSNMDKPNVSAVDLWVGPKDAESLRSHVTSRFLSDDDTSSSESEDSDYVDRYEEDEGSGRKGLKFVDFDEEDIDEDESDQEQTADEEGLRTNLDDENISKDRSDTEESKDSGDSSNESDEVETEDEDVGSLGVKIVDIDDEDEISDLEL